MPADRSDTARVFWLTSGLFFVTLATLMLEVLDTRLLSVLTWYHLSFLAVSVAMLGMAAGAVLVFVGGELFAPERAVRAAAGRRRGVCARAARLARRQPRHPVPVGARRLAGRARRPGGGDARAHHSVRRCPASSSRSR